MDEANLESHGSWQKLGAVEPSWNVPGSLPQWRGWVGGPGLPVVGPVAEVAAVAQHPLPITVYMRSPGRAGRGL